MREKPVTEYRVQQMIRDAIREAVGRKYVNGLAEEVRLIDGRLNTLAHSIYTVEEWERIKPKENGYHFEFSFFDEPTPSIINRIKPIEEFVSRTVAKDTTKRHTEGALRPEYV